MSKKRRTRAQKIIAQLRRQLQTKPTAVPRAPSILKDLPDLPAEVPSDSRGTKVGHPSETPKLYSFDPALIKKDLLKTFYLSGFFFIVIGLIYWFLR